MEAVFPIGPLGVPITPEGNLDGDAQNIPRFAVRKASGREIETTSFLDSRFANVSAVAQAYQNEMYRKGLVLSVIHNPLATNPLPNGLLGACAEFVAEVNGDGYSVRGVANSPGRD
jgi:type I restriction enzyme S subunit